ncbi:ORF160 [Leucania separata nucleopolyhedrovirus]|uniref:ORF160 n=1 Tax=Leucania separata nucleopolyhedrovirus TaxID=1307956 RepID=Q0IKV9_NPVLS|nr:ORF160 [Leucania separata nucleopolyhedrovirus]AAR28924.1 ORF160 [Leucania separata nucleopolyhedrovirus]
MQLAVYIVVFTMGSNFSPALIEAILRKHFHCLYAVHWDNYTCAVCEDSIERTNEGSVRFRMFDKYVRSELQSKCTVNLNDFGELECADSFVSLVSQHGTLPNAMYY